MGTRASSSVGQVKGPDVFLPAVTEDGRHAVGQTADGRLAKRCVLRGPDGDEEIRRETQHHDREVRVA